MSEIVLVATTDIPPPGYFTDHVHGVVCGTNARPVNRFLDGVKSLTGEAARTFPVVLADARMRAVALMCDNARRLGANAVLGVRFDSRPLANDWAELCAYGTAVTLIRLTEFPPGDL